MTKRDPESPNPKVLVVPDGLGDMRAIASLLGAEMLVPLPLPDGYPSPPHGPIPIATFHANRREAELAKQERRRAKNRRRRERRKLGRRWMP